MFLILLVLIAGIEVFWETRVLRRCSPGEISCCCLLTPVQSESSPSKVAELFCLPWSALPALIGRASALSRQRGARIGWDWKLSSYHRLSQFHSDWTGQGFNSPNPKLRQKHLQIHSCVEWTAEWTKDDWRGIIILLKLAGHRTIFHRTTHSVLKKARLLIFFCLVK